MELGKKIFDIPMALEPEYLASPFLDRLSGMTYLSYFMKESQIPQLKIKNFTVLTIYTTANNIFILYFDWIFRQSNWNDKIAVCSLVHSFGAPLLGFNKLSRERGALEPGHPRRRADGSGTRPTDPNVEHLRHGPRRLRPVGYSSPQAVREAQNHSGRKDGPFPQSGKLLHIKKE